jgi:hypothetical protein
MFGDGVHDAGVGGLGVVKDIGMDVAEVRGVDEFEAGAVGGGEEDAAVSAGVRHDGKEDRFERLVQGGGEKVAPGFQVAKGIDNERAAGAQDAADGGEGLSGQQMRGGGVALRDADCPAEIALMRQTAPPRRPILPPGQSPKRSAVRPT